MSSDSEISLFTHHFGRPEPAVPPGDFFADKFDKSLWRMMYDEVGAGWYQDRFLYLFGAELPQLNPLLELWTGLLEPGVERVVIGRNAYGALLVAERTTEEGTDAPIGLLDPAAGTYTKHEGLDFATLITDWLPEHRLPAFVDAAAYAAFRQSGGQLQPQQVLAGSAPEDLLAYHQRMAAQHRA
ncbi:hypothetical protein [Hymenobacter chitinivorans]|uniref:SMI1/KNR4 family protein n=1 Tax=Hymenobacter chitinivorans DSM 11115 TaxID=1121954 RepID=A0A2M9B4V2_9BACT|nr:hypothetical protein [Hymenobacter chitinivorans]PJJ52978.1 hypothetical protein CLV45_3636 [Hymenobacter chitinivorans DSM 11115]